MYKQSRHWEKLWEKPCSKWFVSDIFLLDMFDEVRTKNESAITTVTLQILTCYRALH